MTYLPSPFKAVASLAITAVVAFSVSANAQLRDNSTNFNKTKSQKAAYTKKQTSGRETFSSAEIVTKGHSFFGSTTNGLAQAVEYVFQKAGRPQGYIIGEEGAGAFIGGLRYGEGTLFLKDGTRKKVYWQGPSVGFDFGGNGSRALVLVYNIDDTSDIFSRFVGVDGSAYFIGGLGVNFQSNEKLSLAPIRTGIGARLGANIGYLKYTAKPTWNPF
ncbi:FIG00450386: membrane protein [hydrothermal vent metagenome]|uniref:FIG00450386: membrane protein n=1 Tax=hydrothermal vent metagenome TaxID=652676 RepID=A0A3B0RLK9_9ZZZZ